MCRGPTHPLNTEVGCMRTNRGRTTLATLNMVCSTSNEPATRGDLGPQTGGRTPQQCWTTCFPVRSERGTLRTRSSFSQHHLTVRSTLPSGCGQRGSATGTSESWLAPPRPAGPGQSVVSLSNTLDARYQIAEHWHSLALPDGQFLQHPIGEMMLLGRR